jgi:hypothetical protein
VLTQVADLKPQSTLSAIMTVADAERIVAQILGKDFDEQDALEQAS